MIDSIGNKNINCAFKQLIVILELFCFINSYFTEEKNNSTFGKKN